MMARPDLRLLDRLERTLDNNGGPPDDPHMEERVKRLEVLAEKAQDRLAVIERDLAIIKANYATKEDLHKELHATTWKIIAAIAALCGAVFWLARNVEPPRAALPAAAYSMPAPQVPAAPQPLAK